MLSSLSSNIIHVTTVLSQKNNNIIIVGGRTDTDRFSQLDRCLDDIDLMESGSLSTGPRAETSTATTVSSLQDKVEWRYGDIDPLSLMEAGEHPLFVSSTDTFATLKDEWGTLSQDMINDFEVDMVSEKPPLLLLNGAKPIQTEYISNRIQLFENFSTHFVPPP